ncbi:MAG: hypothetical protein ABJB69_02535 [Spartobacteria bacterium]
MKTRKSNCRSYGEGLVVVIIVLAVIGGGTWYMFSHRKAMDREARTFAHRMIDDLAVKHDVTFFANNLSPQAKRDYPPSQQQLIIAEFTKMGAPRQPINIEEQVSFESHYFFDVRGYFTAHLFYPMGAATMQIAVSHPVGKWQLDNLTFIPERPR